MMPESHESRSVVDLAEQAAAAGDYVSAEQFLREAVRLREEESGPLSPDLANTLNNLGVVSEIRNNADEAEVCYRRAYAIAAATLPPDHPFVATSRKNLADLCAARGKPIDAANLPPVAAPSPSEPAREAPPQVIDLPPPPRAVSSTVVPARFPFAANARTLTAGALLLAGILVATLVTMRLSPEPGREVGDSTPGSGAQESEPAATAEVIPARPTGAAAPVPAAVTGDTKRPVASPGEPAVITAQLCRTLSIKGSSSASDDWPCAAATGQVTAGPIIFYTRLKSARDTTVQHRWYHDDQLYQSVDLPVRANQIKGFRTYSRYTVKTGSSGNWRVELLSKDGRLLHQERFAVQ